MNREAFQFEIIINASVNALYFIFEKLMYSIYIIILSPIQCWVNVGLTSVVQY